LKNRVRCTLAVTVLTSIAALADVSVSLPADGSSVASPVHLVASANAAAGIAAMRVYVDNNSVLLVYSNNVDTYLPMGTGSHYVVISAWDNAGGVYTQALNISVSGGSGVVAVSSPTQGQSAGSPSHFIASSTPPDQNPITAMQIYVDGQLDYTTGSNQLDTYVNLSTGTHHAVVKSWNTAGQNFSQSLDFTVSSNAGTGYYNINRLGGWDSCNACAGAGGSGPPVSYSMTQGVAWPSLDGQSAQFWLGGGIPYAGALWWKQLTPQPAASHFTYDLYFYYQNAGAPQALEFDVNQFVGGPRYIFGTECNFRETGTWRVWDTTNVHWINTGIPCSPSANNWNHLTWQLQRNGDGSYTFVGVTLNGQNSAVNQTYWPIPQSGDELNAAVQLDSNYAGVDYSVWVDEIGLTYY